MIEKELILSFLEEQELNINNLDLKQILMDKGFYYSVSLIEKVRFIQIYSLKNQLSQMQNTEKIRLIGILDRIENTPVNQIYILTYILEKYAYQFYCDHKLMYYFGGIKIHNLNRTKVEKLIEEYNKRGMENNYYPIK